MSGDMPHTLAEAVKRGERRAIAKAITLVESTRREDAISAEHLLAEIHSATGRALRLGVSGVPGAGKSTLIDALGREAIGAGHRVGVLTIDPSSRVSGGSLLGDRTRMGRLAQAEQAFVRPSPSSGASGGLGRRTREASLVLEAAGYDLIIIETVGTGQAEIAISELSDLVLLVLLTGAGDDVQTMKRGILEHADVIAFNKADGDNLGAAQAARDQTSSALSWLRRDAPPVFALSALNDAGITELFQAIVARFARVSADGSLERLRRAQRLIWLEQALTSALLERFAAASNPVLREQLTDAVGRGELLPPLAARQLLQMSPPDS
ncbi:MAG: methylmalonyl Co-A mutase-associated GTPase MeaB [Myxococcota bacterium]